MSVDWKVIESELYMSCVNRQQVVLVKGEGNWVWDDNGKKYLDFTSGWAVNNVGHSNKHVSSLFLGSPCNGIHFPCALQAKLYSHLLSFLREKKVIG